MKRLGILFAVVALLAVVRPVWGAPSFTPVLVEPEQLTGEPGVKVDPTDPSRIFVFAPGASTQLWRSDDGGTTYSHIAATAGGGGDSDLAIDADGVVYASDLDDATLQSTMPVSTSFDHGATFARVRPVLPGGAGWDRQWLAAEGHGHVVASGRMVNQYSAWVSHDAADTFTGPFSIASDVVKGGPLTFLPNGDLVAAYTTSTEVRLAKSVDGGETWTTSSVAPAPDSPLIFPVVAADTAGNLYVVWAQGFRLVVATLEGRVYVARSADGGASWSAPTLLSDAAQTSIFPWVTAGAAGKVDVVFYSARYDVIPDLGAELGGPLTHWDVMISQSLDAASASPTWTRSVAVSDFHNGSECTTGLTCPGIQQTGLGNVPTPFDRRNLDFFEIDSDPSGNAFISYMKDRPFPGQVVGDLILSWTDLTVARQTGGDPIG